MIKNITHIFLSFLLLLSLTGVSSAKTVCAPSFDTQQVEELAGEKCCLVTKEFKKLDTAISSDRASVASPEIDFISVSFIDSDNDCKVAMQALQHSDQLYQSPLNTKDIPVLNQNFRI